MSYDQRFRRCMQDSNSLLTVASHRKHQTSVVSVCGPSGAGKSTVVRALMREFASYVESTDMNPHLPKWLEGSTDFDASANQQWFLHQIGECIHKADAQQSLILDQDPEAIVKIYARMFRDDGLIDDDSYGRLLVELQRIEKSLARWQTPRTIFLLDAPAEMLRERAGRCSRNALPPLKWFATVRSYFYELSPEWGNVTVVPTGSVTVEHVIRQISDLLNGEIETAT